MNRTSNIDGIWLYRTKAAISIEILKNALDSCNGDRDFSNCNHSSGGVSLNRINGQS